MTGTVQVPVELFERDADGTVVGASQAMIDWMSVVSSVATGQDDYFSLVAADVQHVQSPSRWENNQSYSLFNNVLATTIYLAPAGTTTVPAGKKNDFIRCDWSVEPQGTGKARLLNFNITDVSMSPTAETNAVIGAITGTGANIIKTLYGRAGAGAGFTGVLVGLVGAVSVNAAAAPTLACMLQLEHQGHAHVGCFVNTSNPGDRLDNAFAVDNSSAVQACAYQYLQRLAAPGSFLRMFDSSAVSVFEVDNEANVLLGGTGQRIKGDFSHPKLADRVIFQTRTANGATAVSCMPDGSGTVAQFTAYGGSTPSAASRVSLQMMEGGAVALVNSASTGATTRPLALAIDDVGYFFLHTNGDNQLGSAGATDMSAGLPYIPSASGPPTGIPTTRAGFSPLYLDTHNQRLCYYDDVAAKWRTSPAFT